MQRTWPIGWAKVPRRFRRDQSGATAVEFALVAAPFFALVFAILEIALLFFAQQVLDTGVTQAARLIRTGQAVDFNEAEFKQEICDRIAAMFDCDSIRLDVKVYADFASINVDDPIDPDTQELDDEGFTYNSGNGGDIVVVRAFYRWPTIVPGFGADVGNLADGSRLIGSTVAFRNEPFGGN